ncbi:MAG: hypothetical protein IKA22_11735 [Lentisphaeria bacterium]|nr:hypothetical protein [Lentisphaeria bacterium]
MKPKSKMTLWFESQAAKHNLSITTIKNCYAKSDKIRAEYDKLIAEAKKRHYVAKPKITSIIIPSSFIWQSLLKYKISRYRIPDFALHNAEYAYVVSNENDYYAEELKIDRTENDFIDFYGFDYDEFIILSALYTAIHDNYNITQAKTYVTTSIPVDVVWNMLYPSSRWNGVKSKIKGCFVKKIIDLSKKIKKIKCKYWCKGLKQPLTTYDDCKAIMSISVTGDSISSAIVTASISNDNIWRQAEKQKRLISINNKMYDYGRDIINGSISNHLAAKIYISYRIKINSSKIKNSITKKTLTAICGKVDNDYINRYMQHLVDNGTITKYTSTRHGIAWEMQDAKKQSLIIMHDEDGKMSKNAPEATEEVIQREKDLRIINSFTSRYEVKSGKRLINTELHSTYCNNDWMQGGRLYTSAGGYQSLSKEDRSKLTINGKPVVELDYSAYHPHILYALSGATLMTDPYNFYHDRKIAKLALNIVINAKNKSEAIGAIKVKINKSVDVNALLDAMEKEHQAIVHHFYLGAGIFLQNFDADIAVKIVLKMRAKRILALPVHDSFIVDARFEQKLRQTMDEVYAEVTGGFRCPIK